MANPSGHFRQSDVTRWAIIALVCSALAVLAANVSALLPPSVLNGLHKSRLEGASLEQLQDQVAELNSETVRLRRDNGTLLNRFALQEQAGRQTVQRVGALEVSVPNLLEALPAGLGIDREAVTASVGEDGSVVEEAQGGSVRIRRTPLPALPSLSPNQPLPERLGVQQAATGEGSAFGVAVGDAIAPAEANAAWRELQDKVGPLLLGLVPLLGQQAGSEQERIIAGPMGEEGEAAALCARLQQVSIACSPAPYRGTGL
ncbi:hypothetical protein [Devosia sp. 1566]|uniref:hypothetical protein n=1 Tax=Devosia sp. 1566 TaxID=2499144 RepID=UPI000FD762EB|nr:hypothetical protein [Devosia sp. 1566]